MTINNTPYQLSDLHSSTDGKFISFLYEVKEIDDGTLTVSIAGTPASPISSATMPTRWTRSFPSMAEAPDTGITLVSPLMKNAVDSLGVTYANGALNFTIAAKQDEAYQNLYGNYRGNPTGLMRLLITVDGGTAKTHTVTMGEDPNNATNFTFTAAALPYCPHRPGADRHRPAPGKGRRRSGSPSTG